MGEKEQLDHEQPDGPLDNLEDQAEDNSDKATKTGVSTSRDLETLDRTRVNVHSTTLECPDCHKSYPELPRIVHDVEAAWRSVKSHVQRKHKRKLQRSEMGLPELPTPPVKGKKVKGEAVTIPVIEVEMDDVDKDQLAEMKKRRTLAEEQAKMLEAETVLERMEDRRDDYTPWDRGRRRWDRSNRHDDGDSGLSKEDLKKMGKMEAQIEQYESEEESVSSQAETINDLMEQMDAKDKLMFEQMRQENENRNRDKDRAHGKEMELLRQMAEDRRAADNRYHELQIASLRNEMKHEGKNEPLVEAMNRGFDSVDKYLGILFSAGGGNQPPPQLPRVVAPGLMSISDMVAKENPGIVEEWSGESHE